MTEVITIVYRLGSRGEMSADDVLDAHLFHAKSNDNRVLFTVPTQNNTKVGKKRKDIDNIILTLKDGSKALFAELDDYGSYPCKYPDPIYKLPYQWNPSQEIDQGYTWFALRGVKEISKEELDSYKTMNENEYPILQSLSGASCRVYGTKK